MSIALVIIVFIGLGFGLWGEFSEQRRIERMAKSFKAQETGGNTHDR